MDCNTFNSLTVPVNVSVVVIALSKLGAIRNCATRTILLPNLVSSLGNEYLTYIWMYDVDIILMSTWDVKERSAGYWQCDHWCLAFIFSEVRWDGVFLSEFSVNWHHYTVLNFFIDTISTICWNISKRNTKITYTNHFYLYMNKIMIIVINWL